MKRRNWIRTILAGMITSPFALLFRKKEKPGTARPLSREGVLCASSPAHSSLSPSPSPLAPLIWQIDPDKCTQCGRCETECILKPSAVKCVHQYESCGYCLFCSGYYHDNRANFDTAGENLRCPTDAIIRRYIEDPYFEYTIDEDKCIGCGKCVKGCKSFGNGSLFLQVRRGLCKQCNQCRIAAVCPSNAFTKVSVNEPYIIKHSPDIDNPSEPQS